MTYTIYTRYLYTKYIAERKKSNRDSSRFPGSRLILPTWENTEQAICCTMAAIFKPTHLFAGNLLPGKTGA
ncbi:hypothetical protein HMPREF9374_3027 [Desmospora sp. 8437]|nr:hypothetical protein HMPREF9374_3027 [Desmospora sp. 8437]